MTGEIEDLLAALYRRAFGAPPDRIVPIRDGGSGRRRFRLTGGERSVVGVGNENRGENAAFIGFSRHFLSIGLPVPEIFAEDLDNGVYLETDLGDDTLADRIAGEGRGGGDKTPLDLCEEAIAVLPRFQVAGRKGLDFSLCYQGEEFDEEAMWNDLVYFRDRFLRPFCAADWRKERLASDFRLLAARLSREKREYFLYRDFQPRNVLVSGGNLYFIDYQSGRLGALPYDVASFISSGSAPTGPGVEERLLARYFDAIERMISFDRDRFLRVYPGFLLIRRLQALGAYGNLGVRKGKRWFLGKIPLALERLKDLLEDENLFADLPELAKVLRRLTTDPGSWKAHTR